VRGLSRGRSGPPRACPKTPPVPCAPGRRRSNGQPAARGLRRRRRGETLPRSGQRPGSARAVGSGREGRLVEPDEQPPPCRSRRGSGSTLMPARDHWRTCPTALERTTRSSLMTRWCRGRRAVGVRQRGTGSPATTSVSGSAIPPRQARPASSPAAVCRRRCAPKTFATPPWPAVPPSPRCSEPGSGEAGAERSAASRRRRSRAGRSCSRLIRFSRLPRSRAPGRRRRGRARDRRQRRARSPARRPPPERGRSAPATPSGLIGFMRVRHAGFRPCEDLRARFRWPVRRGPGSPGPYGAGPGAVRRARSPRAGMGRPSRCAARGPGRDCAPGPHRTRTVALGGAGGLVLSRGKEPTAPGRHPTLADYGRGLFSFTSTAPEWALT